MTFRTDYEDLSTDAGQYRAGYRPGIATVYHRDGIYAGKSIGRVTHEVVEPNSRSRSAYPKAWVIRDTDGRWIGREATRKAAVAELVRVHEYQADRAEAQRQPASVVEPAPAAEMTEQDHRHGPAGNSSTSGPFIAFDGSDYFATYSTCASCRVKIIRLDVVGEAPIDNRRQWIPVDELNAAYAEHEQRGLTPTDLANTTHDQFQEILRRRNISASLVVDYVLSPFVDDLEHARRWADDARQLDHLMNRVCDAWSARRSARAAGDESGADQ